MPSSTGEWIAAIIICIECVVIVGIAFWIVQMALEDNRKRKESKWDYLVRAARSKSLHPPPSQPQSLSAMNQAIKSLYRPGVLTGTTNQSLKKSQPEAQLKDTYLIGYRMWPVREGDKLFARVAQAEWKVGANRAECRVEFIPGGESRHAPDNIPAHGCTCGLYAYAEPDWLHGMRCEPSHITGAVLMWGRIEVHANGMRAEYAMPIVILGNGKTARDVAKRYHCTTAGSVEQLVEIAEQHGQHLPKELRPPSTVLDEALPKALSSPLSSHRPLPTTSSFPPYVDKATYEKWLRARGLDGRWR